MSSGIDVGLRKSFLGRLRATHRFWELSKQDYMFVDPEFHAWIDGVGDISRPDEWENFPAPTAPYHYVNSFKPHSQVVQKIYEIAKTEVSEIGVFPVNSYAWGFRIDGPYLHVVDKMVSFTPRGESDHWIHDWPWFNDGRCFFVPKDVSWAYYTSKSNDPNSVDFLLADQDFLGKVNQLWPDIVDYVHR